jgi:glycosyltransferase involved in cell wall biosynthesis
MKTLQIGMDWFPDKQGGGLDRFYYDFTQHLPKVGVEVSGLVTGPTRLLSESNNRIYGFAPRETPILQRWQGIRNLSSKLLQEQDFDLIAAHFALYTFPILDQLKQKKLVFHFHGPWSLESIVESDKSLGFWLRKMMELTVFRRSSHFIVLSGAFQDILHKMYGVSLEKIHIVPGGVDTSRFDCSLSKKVAREKLSWSQDRQVIFVARRLSKRMGLENLLAAMQTVCKSHKDILLLVAGKGALESTLHQQIKELNLTNNVHLLGYVPEADLTLAYRAADFTIVPTETLEGFGLVVLESLAAGTPVLGTPVGGIPEILDPFSKDLVFEGYLPQQLARGILEVLDGIRKLPGDQECQMYVNDHYSWMEIASQIRSIYQDFVGGNI